MEYFPYLPSYHVKNVAGRSSTMVVATLHHKFCPTAKVIDTGIFRYAHLPDLRKIWKVPLLKPEGILHPST